MHLALANTTTSVEIKRPLGGIITCMSNSRHWQKVTLTWGNTTITFMGVGAGVPMKLADGSTAYAMMSSLQPYTITARFEYAVAGVQGPFMPALVEQPIVIPNRHRIQILISADEAMECVNNDALLLISYESADQSRQRPLLRPQALGQVHEERRNTHHTR